MLSQSVIWIDRGTMLYEMAYEPALKEAMQMYQEAYNQSGGDLTNLNQSSLKTWFSQKLYGEWDLYLIDQRGIVINTTFPADNGLDFSRYPALFDAYSGYMQTGELVIDRTVKGFAPGAPHRKFIYQGTPDHRYLLEISKNFKNFYPGENKASYHELINTTLRSNPYIVSIEIYNSQQSVVAAASPNQTLKKPDSDILRAVSKTFSFRTITTSPGPGNNQITEYRFLPVVNTGSPSTSLMHLVARIVYTIEPLQTRLLHLVILVSSFLIITLSVGMIVAVGVSRHLTRPLNRIGDDVDQIAGGDLDHQITPTGVIETERIERSINQMVEHLKDHIETLRLQEAELQEELQNRQKAEDRYRRLFDSSHEAIFILELGVIRDCNEEACTLFRATREDLIDKKLINFIPPALKNQDTILNHVENGLFPISPNYTDAGNVSDVELSESCVFFRLDGALIETDLYINPVNLDHSIIMQVMVRDITILNEMARRELLAITQIEENLVQLAAINDQIRNPLSIILALCEIYGGDYADKIYTQISRIDTLINEIDKGFISTDKVRMYLKKHYEVTGPHIIPDEEFKS